MFSDDFVDEKSNLDLGFILGDQVTFSFYHPNNQPQLVINMLTKCTLNANINL